MSLGVFLAVIGAAFLHALWNALIKMGTAKLTGMLILTLVQGAIGLIIATRREQPAGQIWLWLLASGVFHTAYKLFLAYAYDRGDLSRVYPIARGAAPMIVLAVAAIVLNDQIEVWEYAGILVLGAGILLMAKGVFKSGESSRLIPLALGSAMATAGYSLVDGLGARFAGDAVTYVAWLFVLDALFFTPTCVAIRGWSVLVAPRKAWVLGSFAAMASYGAYAIAIWAMTQAPIALVTALRETSILFAVLIGWIFFCRTYGPWQVLGSGIDRSWSDSYPAVTVLAGKTLETCSYLSGSRFGRRGPWSMRGQEILPMAGGLAGVSEVQVWQASDRFDDDGYSGWEDD